MIDFSTNAIVFSLSSLEHNHYWSSTILNMNEVMFCEFRLGSLTLGNGFQEQDSIALRCADEFIEVNDPHVAAHTGRHLTELRIQSAFVSVC